MFAVDAFRHVELRWYVMQEISIPEKWDFRNGINAGLPYLLFEFAYSPV